jgi:hypothetical protein
MLGRDDRASPFAKSQGIEGATPPALAKLRALPPTR